MKYTTKDLITNWLMGIALFGVILLNIFMPTEDTSDQRIKLAPCIEGTIEVGYGQCILPEELENEH